MLPKKKLILEFKQFFFEEPPIDRISLIKSIPKIQLIYEIAGLNYRLKPSDKLYFNYSIEFQLVELKYFCGGNQGLFSSYLSIFKNYITVSEYPLIFNRASNLFALEEIINCPFLIEDHDFNMDRQEVWDGILKYYLAVNSEIVKIKPLPITDLSFEQVSANALVLNELSIQSNPLYSIYRGIRLMNYLSTKSPYHLEFKDYFEKVVKMDKDEFIYRIIAISILNKKPTFWEEFVYNLKEPDTFFDYLSLSNTDSITPGRLITLKKSPFFKQDDLTYVLLDNTFLLNKCYSSFINDFWFNWLKNMIDNKGRSIYSIMHYKGDIGYFFEDYVETIVKNSFRLLHNPPPMCFKDLIVSSSLGQLEIADIYIRMGNCVLVGQVKSGSIYDNEKYSGDINTLYKEDRDRFFSEFGVNQTLESLHKILKNYEKIDPDLSLYDELFFFPVIIVQEILFQTPLIPSLLNIRFQELLVTENLSPHNVNPLITVHISDLEYIEYKLTESPELIWDLLHSIYKEQENQYIPPFYSVTSKYIGVESMVKRAMDAIEEIRSKYATTL